MSPLAASSLPATFLDRRLLTRASINVSHSNTSIGITKISSRDIMSLLFSIPALFSLSIFCISILRKQVSHFPPPIMLISYVILIASHLKWACNFLLYHSFSKQYSQQEMAEMGEELSIERYKCREEEMECPVCLCVIEEGEEIRELRCEHLFHRDCLDRWVGYRHVNCPLCRGSLFPCTTVQGDHENYVEVLFFKYCSFTSSSRHRRNRWWLR